MPLGTEVGLALGHFLLDGDPEAPPKGAQSLNFRPMFVVAKQMNGS